MTGRVALADEYRQQFGWRAWPVVFDALPPLRDRLVLDLGCAIGDQAAALVARGARVIGLDANEELLDVARARSLDGAEFRRCDLCALPELGVLADGLWGSFVPAYFPDLPEAVETWSQHLRPGGWIALTEVDDLFGHEPLLSETRSILEAYAREALAAKRYDFHMGRKLGAALRQCGFSISADLTLADQELSFDGPARPEVIEAWARRLDRLKLLRDRAGAGFEALREDLLQCLASPSHRSTAKVHCVIATK